jgi:hypothetical protein
MYIVIDLIEVQFTLYMVLSLVWDYTFIIFTQTMIYKLLAALEASSTFCIFYIANISLSILLAIITYIGIYTQY